MTRTNIACLHSLAFDGCYVSSFRNEWTWSRSWDTETIESRSWSHSHGSSRYNTNSGQGGKEKQ
jgi:hypothetical protein